MKLNTHQDIANLEKTLTKLLVILMWLIPIYIAADSALYRYNASKQTKHTHQYWLPLKSKLFVDEKAMREYLGEEIEFLNVQILSSYKYSFENEQHLVVFSKGMVTYVTVHGKMAIRVDDREDGTPASTEIVSATHVGNGLVEMELKRFYGTLIAIPILKGIVFGACFDIATAFILVVIWIFVEKWLVKKIRNKESQALAVTT